ncbi:hypothetical protein C1H46_040900 [Malus baccata]|uniref:Uncharacterized protein n=1 Tax=Malus baccata TaxID=106549 RepID=A0A540KH63_MALBA|nr:hypothetical protein C1H46_040900 [Malus baccata]
MVKDLATYFSMTLGTFVFWQSLDEVQVQIALHQDKKKIRFLGNWHEIWWLGYREFGRKSGVGGIPYVSDFSCLLFTFLFSLSLRLIPYLNHRDPTSWQPPPSHLSILEYKFFLSLKAATPSDYEPHRHPPCSTLTRASFPYFPKPISPSFPQPPSACPQLTLHHNHHQDIHNIRNSKPKLPFFFVDEDLDKLGFEKVTEEFIGECKLEALLLRHKKTGAQVASLSSDDENKVFGIIF